MRDSFLISPERGEVIAFPDTSAALPPFVRKAGLRPADLRRFGADVSADRRVLFFVERGADGLPCGTFTDGGPGGARWFTRGAPRGLTTGTVRPGPARLLLTCGGFDALCASAWEGHRPDTLYVGLPGSLPRFALLALEALLAHARPRRVEVTMPRAAAGQKILCEVVELVEGNWGDLMDVGVSEMDRAWPELLSAKRRGGR